MPSPFPGMDPYLEDAAIWPGVHHRLISAVSDQLQPLLVARGYFVDVESRVWLEEAKGLVRPDVVVASLSTPRAEGPADETVLVLDEPVRLPILVEELHEAYLEIHEIATKRLVTGIEILSPSNKQAHISRKLYLRKRKSLRKDGVNVVEIDLLRGGKPLARLPRSVVEGWPRDVSVVNIIRPRAEDYEFYPIEIRSRLPRFGVPLKRGEADVPLDLQAALSRVFEVGYYEGRIDYARDPVPRLSPDNAEWANALLIEKNLRLRIA